MADGDITVDVIPRIGAHKFEHVGGVRAADNGASIQQSRPPEQPIANVKTLLSVSNEYWLIGINLVLIVAVLMLIIYIVKIKQGMPKTKPELEPEPEPDSKPPRLIGSGNQCQTLPAREHDRAREISANEMMQINAQIHRNFIPRSGQTVRNGPIIEALNDENDARLDAAADEDLGENMTTHDAAGEAMIENEASQEKKYLNSDQFMTRDNIPVQSSFQDHNTDAQQGARCAGALAPPPSSTTIDAPATIAPGSKTTRRRRQSSIAATSSAPAMQSSGQDA